MTASTPNTNGRPGEGGSKLFPIAIGAIVFIGIALVAALAIGRNDDSGTDSSGDPVAQVAEVDISGEPLVAYPDGANPGDPASDPAVGMTAPTIIGTDFDGNEIELGPDGTPKVVLFLAHWCPHCQRELPAAVELMNSSDMPDGLDVYAVSTAFDDTRGAPDPSDWFAAENWEGPVIRDSATSEAFFSYGGAGFPFAVYLDGESQVLLRTSGELGIEDMTTLWLATAQS